VRVVFAILLSLVFLILGALGSCLVLFGAMWGSRPARATENLVVAGLWIGLIALWGWIMSRLFRKRKEP
jgi:hypothetical protein